MSGTNTGPRAHHKMPAGCSSRKAATTSDEAGGGATEHAQPAAPRATGGEHARARELEAARALLDGAAHFDRGQVVGGVHLGIARAHHLDVALAVEEHDGGGDRPAA